MPRCTVACPHALATWRVHMHWPRGVCARLDAERVDPHAERALLAAVASVVVGQLGEELELRLIGRVEAGARVEQRGDEGEVELLVAAHDVHRLHGELGAETLALAHDVRRAARAVVVAEHVRVCDPLRVDLLEEVAVHV